MRALKLCASALLITAVSTAAMAQGQPPRRGGGEGGGGGGPGGNGPMAARQQLSPEKAKAAWELEAHTIGAGLGLDKDKAAALTKAYVEARESHNAATEKLRKEMRDKRDGGGPDGNMDDIRGAMNELREKMETLNKNERAKFEKAVSGTLSADQSKKAMETLGSFNRQWDVMTDSIAGLKLESAKQDQALKAVGDYVADVSKHRGGDDPEAMRDAMQSARKKLNDSLKGILSEEQMKQFEASMPGRRGGGGEGDGQRPPRRQRGEGGGEGDKDKGKGKGDGGKGG